MKSLLFKLSILFALLCAFVINPTLIVNAEDNTTSPEFQKAVTVQIPVSCIAEGIDETFQFQCISMETYRSEHQKVMLDHIQLKDNENGNFQVNIFYPGTYRYDVSEARGTSKNIAYDETIYEVDIFVSENEYGNMDTEVVAFKKGAEEKVDSLSFHNMANDKTGAEIDKTENGKTEPSGKENITDVKPDVKTNQKGNTVKTGDTGIKRIACFLMMLILSGGVILLSLRIKRRGKSEN